MVGCSECIDSPDKCDKCDSGYFRDNNTAICYSCRSVYPNCSLCDVVIGLFVCTNCDDGYFPTTKNCSLCDSQIPKCLNCTADGATCLSCEENYVLADLKCVYCSVQIPDCVSCENNICTHCGNGKVLADDGLTCN